MKFRTYAAVIITLLAGAGVAHAQPQPAAADQGAQAPKGGERGRVTLISPGSDERRELRYAPKAGTSVSVRTRGRTVIKTQVDEEAIDTPEVPSTSTPIDVKVEAVDGGVMTLVATPGEGKYEDDGSAELRAAANGAKVKPGPVIKVSVSTTGRIDGKLKVDGGAKPSLREGGVLDAMILPFPDEPVGAGAKWRINAQDGVRGFAGQTIAEVDLLELTATGGRVKLSYRKDFDKAEKDSLDEAEKRGMTVTKSSRTIDYEGEVSFTFDSPVATIVKHTRVVTQRLELRHKDNPGPSSTMTSVERTTQEASREAR